MKLAGSLVLLIVWPNLRAQQADAPLSPTEMQQELDAYRRLLMDWGGLTQYGSDDAELRLKSAENRVVF